MKLSEYQKKSERTLPEYMEWEDKKSAVSNYCMGLAGESGEVIDIFKKSFHHGHTLDIDEVEKELGDTLHYLSGLATMVGSSLEVIAEKNIQKLLTRYPNGFNQEDSINRKDVKA